MRMVIAIVPLAGSRSEHQSASPQPAHWACGRITKAGRHSGPGERWCRYPGALYSPGI